MNTISFVTFVSRLCPFPISRRAAVALVVLTWSSRAFSGEIDGAVQHGDLEKVKALLKADPELVFSNTFAEFNFNGPAPPHFTNGCTLLFLAARAGRRDVVELLLANKAEVNAQAAYGETPLHEAAMNRFKDKDVVGLLLTNKAEVNAKDNLGVTPLHCAAGVGHKDVVELLLAWKAEVNAKDQWGRTPLQWAAERGHKDVVELLLGKKVELDAKDKSGRTPLYYAVVSPKFDRNSRSGTFVPHEPYVDVAKLLLAHHAEPEAKDILGRTLLHYTATYGYKDMAELLLTYKADINAKDEEGRTPLRLAMLNGHNDVAELLRQHGGHE